MNSKASPTPNPNPAGGTGLRVLIVDDDEIALQILKECLEDVGHTVMTRSNALGTSALVMRDRPDVALLDVNMPGLTGDSIARLIRQGTGDFKPAVMLMTTDYTPRVDQLAQGCGAIGVLEKTADSSGFVKKFEAMYARRA